MYYFTAQNIGKDDNGKEVASADSGIFSYRTLSSLPPSPTYGNTKTIYKSIKAGKTFSVNYRMRYQDSQAYISKFKRLYPYYFSAYGGKLAYKCEDVGEAPNSPITGKITFKPNKGFAKANATQKRVNKIVAGAKKKKSDAERVKYVNNKIKSICSYSFKSKEPRSAYGCLVEKKCVCVGYAEAFRWCVSELGIPNTMVDTKSHSWNKVYIKYKGKKRWWHVDVTWNDTTKSNRYLLTKSHEK